MANHHGTQCGFHPSPPCRQPLCSGGAALDTHTAWPARARAKPCQAHPPRTVRWGHATILQTSNWVGRRWWHLPRWAPYARAAAKAVGFPTHQHTVPARHSHAGMPDSGKRTHARQSLSPTCPGLPRRSPPQRGQGCPHGHHRLHAYSETSPCSWPRAHPALLASCGASTARATTMGTNLRQAIPHHRAGKRGCVVPPRGGGDGLRSLKCQTTRRSLEIHLSPLPLGAAGAGRLWR